MCVCALAVVRRSYLWDGYPNLASVFPFSLGEVSWCDWMCDWTVRMGKVRVGTVVR